VRILLKKENPPRQGEERRLPFGPGKGKKRKGNLFKPATGLEFV